jgi:hypothetical protein
MSVSVLVTVLGATVPGSTVTVSAGAAPPDESCLSWWPPPPPPEFAAELVVVVVVVVVLVVGAVVPFEPHATDSIPAAMATTPIVNGARRHTRAMINANGISLPSQSYDVTARFIPARGRQATGPQVGLCV